ncbi:hypothetical protein F5148DRAFT_132900 [Russula earlei]|uniref:Uncharacterized protein n=1 Tax=Russula earlei TaxID=71964 RepID=A0ACC0U6K2_9AGAM|nr:hypothetical protein F5148DRAFT_132900 [Russula earlei]
MCVTSRRVTLTGNECLVLYTSSLMACQVLNVTLFERSPRRVWQGPRRPSSALQSVKATCAHLIELATYVPSLLRDYSPNFVLLFTLLCDGRACRYYLSIDHHAIKPYFSSSRNKHFSGHEIIPRRHTVTLSCLRGYILRAVMRRVAAAQVRAQTPITAQASRTH